MKNLVIGCRTLENELLAAMKLCEKTYTVRWIDARLHNVKEKLNHSLQSIIDSAQDYDRILMATGFCGNAIDGLKTSRIPVIIPKVDDCTSLLFNSCKNRQAHAGSYFLTEGWLRGDSNIWAEYQYSLKKYGEKLTQKIFRTMFEHYRQIALLDTGCYPIAPSLAQAQVIADTFSLECAVIPVTIDFLTQLLNGPWDSERFLTVLPNTEITASDLTVTC